MTDQQRNELFPAPLLAGNCVFRLKDVRQCKRPATELTTWGAFCWQHASPRFAIRSLTQGQADKAIPADSADHGAVEQEQK